MAKLSKETLFKVQPAKSETPMDKTTRIVRKMIDDEAEKRLAKINRLRVARLEREAHSPIGSDKPKRKSNPTKTAAK